MFEALLELQRKRRAAATQVPIFDPSAFMQTKVGPDIEAAPPYIPPPMQMQIAEQQGPDFSRIAALGAQRMMNEVLKKKAADTSGISTAQASARRITPGFMGGQGALTPAGTPFFGGTKLKF